MIKSKNFLVTLFATFLLVCFVSMADVENNPVAEVMVDSSGINFMPRVNFVRLYISLSRADGSVIQKTFNSGSAPYLSLSTILGERPCDGLYTYELLVVSAVVKRSRGIDGFSSNSKTPRSQEALTQTGYFTVRGGMIVTPGAIEPENVISTIQDGLSGTKDQVILDDLIVDGSLCVGMDCVNGESFGFDTIRLKENNLRIRFVDTSSTSSFPSRDWQITVNDSANGGANKFSIDDLDGGRTPFTIEAGAPSHSLYVDDGGRVGFGTSTPVADLHVKTGNTPTLRLEQDGSSGFTPQTWDIAGNEANFFIRDGTNGSTLPFRIIPGAPSNSVYIDTDGDVGVGTTSPGANLHVSRTTSGGADLLKLENNGATRLVLNNTSTGQIWRLNSSSTSDFRIAEDTGATAFVLQTNGDLEIAGALKTAGGNYPDYVFEPDYQLMPLEELAEYIKKEKHLPRIPKAAEVKKGINMTELQLQLLEKVEELTLYTLSQQETINELKKEIAALKKKSQ